VHPGHANGSPAEPMVLHARVITGAGGGPDKTILNSPRFLQRHGYQCVCLFLRPPGDAQFEVIRRRAQEARAEIVEFDDRGPWSRSIVARTCELCAQHSVDVWHAHDYKTNLLGLLVNRRRPMKLVTTCHGWVERTWRTTVYHQIDRFTLRRYDHVVAVSADIEAQCRCLGVDDERLSLIENAIDTEQYCRRQSIAAAKQLLGWDPNQLAVGAVGRLSEEKGFDLLIRAVGQIVASGYDMKLAIAGGGPEQPKLVRLIRELGVEQHVQLMGFQSNLIPIYEAMDAFVLSSRREGLPNVLLEAMALGVPVVATRVAGVPSLLNDGLNGLLTHPNDAGQLVGPLTRLLMDSDLRGKLAQAGQETIQSRYSFDVRMAKEAAIYDRMFFPNRHGSRSER
jgi:glycosyltransferase involved in cell wall biosynthesis